MMKSVFVNGKEAKFKFNLFLGWEIQLNGETLAINADVEDKADNVEKLPTIVK